MADIFAAIDISTAAATLTLILVAGIGIRMAFKGSALGKQAIKSA